MFSNVLQCMGKKGYTTVSSTVIYKAQAKKVTHYWSRWRKTMARGTLDSTFKKNPSS